MAIASVFPLTADEATRAGKIRWMKNPLARCVSALQWFLLLPLFATLTLAANAAEPVPFTRLGASHEITPDLEVFDFEERVWVYRATQVMEPWGPISSNGLIVAGGDEVWILDTPWSDELTAKLFDWIESNIGNIAGLIASHFHHDRLGGIAEVRRRGITSWGHVKTARLASTSKLLSPERTFETSITLSVGGESFEMFYPGPGHTIDNTVVWFPERGLLYGGCLIKSAGSRSAGNLADAELEAWPSSLAAIAERYATIRTVIPGHGSPGSVDLLEHTLALVKDASAAK